MAEATSPRSWPSCGDCWGAGDSGGIVSVSVSVSALPSLPVPGQERAIELAPTPVSVGCSRAPGRFWSNSGNARSNLVDVGRTRANVGSNPGNFGRSRLTAARISPIQPEASRFRAELADVGRIRPQYGDIGPNSAAFDLAQFPISADTVPDSGKFGGEFEADSERLCGPGSGR